MKCFTSVSVETNCLDILEHLCIHSRAASYVTPDWENIWNFEMEDGVTSHEVLCNEDVEVCTMMEYKKGEMFLAAVRMDQKVHILYTVTKRQTSSFCSTFY